MTRVTAQFMLQLPVSTVSHYFVRKNDLSSLNIQKLQQFMRFLKG